ncbi:dihydrofolate reductase [Clostridium cavendishii DSM 21758]|uniref:Dihydrofolate reductase n=1 Tax=Clostridium cavendishii DSM 21758 TaxID=1121302 RepID=A0A1M6SX78_9CLOT|nr:dihydrofolate reductase [Clostridium cavendishii]SHK49303.1 dihydrofolate reductase [Clostridium cavendishii DSM 21758]
MLSIIVAVSANNVIGANNKLLWHISEDLKRFKTITTGHKIIMGRKTFESLPSILPNRHHIVITKDTNFKVDDERVTVIHDINDIIKEYENSNEETFIIGGGQIYKQLLPYAKKIYLTKLNKSYEGDTYFPEIDMNLWREMDCISMSASSNDTIDFSFITLERV